MRWPLAILGAVTLGAPTIHAQSPVHFFIRTSTGNDTLYAGVPSQLFFDFDPGGHIVLGLVFPMQFVFEESHLLGPLDRSDFTFTPETIEIYELPQNVNLSAWDGVGTDSLLVGLLDGGGDHWPDSAELWRLTVVPQSTGRFRIDSILFPPQNTWSALDETAQPLPFEIVNYGRDYTVVWLNGDVTSDGSINAGDILYIVNWIFKSGPQPPFCSGLGDVDCSGTCTSADIIQVINFAFKSGPAPCDLSALIPDPWVCP